MSSSSQLTVRLLSLREWLVGIMSSPLFAKVRIGASICLTCGVLIFLISQLRSVGFDTIRVDLPTSAAFYVLLVFIYFLQPFGDFLVFRFLWDLKGLNAFAAFLRKRVFDAAVMSYSGEAYLYLWAQKRTAHPRARLLSDIKDNVIVSAVISNTATLVTVLIFLSTGQIQRFFNVAPDMETYVVIAGAFAGILGVIVLRFRAFILALSARALAVVSSIHGARLIIVLSLQALLWALALPGVPYQTWMVLLTLQLVLTRIPFLPNQDLIFLTLVMSVAGFIQAETSSVAAAFTVIGFSTQVLHVISFGLTSFTWRP